MIMLNSSINRFRELCSPLGIINAFSLPTHLVSNGQVEVVNKLIKHNLK